MSRIQHSENLRGAGRRRWKLSKHPKMDSTVQTCPLQTLLPCPSPTDHHQRPPHPSLLPPAMGGLAWWTAFPGTGGCPATPPQCPCPAHQALRLQLLSHLLPSSRAALRTRYRSPTVSQFSSSSSLLRFCRGSRWPHWLPSVVTTLLLVQLLKPFRSVSDCGGNFRFFPNTLNPVKSSLLSFLLNSFFLPPRAGGSALGQDTLIYFALSLPSSQIPA